MPEQLFGEYNNDLSISGKMNSYRFFIEDNAAWTRIAGVLGTILILSGVSLIGIFLMVGYVKGGIVNNSVDNMLALICVLASVAGFILTGISCYRSPIKNVFVLAPTNKLWCFISEDEIPFTTITRKELLNEREKVFGPSRELTNKEIKQLLTVLNYIDDFELGNAKRANYEIDNIEDIESIKNNTDDKTVTITYTDKISGERRDITLDNYRWKTFLSWLNEKREEYE